MLTGGVLRGRTALSATTRGVHRPIQLMLVEPSCTLLCNLYASLGSTQPQQPSSAICKRSSVAHPYWDSSDAAPLFIQLTLYHRCRAKYGSSWQKYSDLVPYKMIPYVW